MKNNLIKLLININDKLIELIARSTKNNLKSPLKSNYYAETQNLVKKFKKITLFGFWEEYVDGPQAPHYNIPYKGHKLSKFPADMFIYPDIIYRLKPEIILEIGTQRGGSAIYFSDLLEPIDGRVITVDIKPPKDNDTLTQFKEKEITSIKGDVTNPGTIKKIHDLCIEKRCLIIDDGSHYENHVYNTFFSLQHLIPIGGLYIIEDGMTCAIYHPREEKYKTNRAIARILNEFPNFELFREYDNFIFSTVLMGILQRKI